MSWAKVATDRQFLLFKVVHRLPVLTDLGSRHPTMALGYASLYLAEVGGSRRW